jgi:hypothetical protein
VAVVSKGRAKEYSLRNQYFYKFMYAINIKENDYGTVRSKEEKGRDVVLLL